MRAHSPDGAERVLVVRLERLRRTPLLGEHVAEVVPRQGDLRIAEQAET